MSSQVEVAFSVVSAGNSPLVTPVTAASPLPVTVAAPLNISPQPQNVAALALAPVAQGNTALAGSGALKATAGNLYGINGYSSAAGFLLLYDLGAPPADGATTASLKKVFAVAAGATFEFDFPIPLRGTAGWSWVFSSTAPVVQTTSATAFVSAQVI